LTNENPHMPPRESEGDLRQEIASMLNLFSFNTEVSKPIKGRSGVMHEIDIIAKKRDGQTRLLIKTKSVDEGTFLRIDEVLSFWAQIFDTTVDRGAIVTTCKVSDPAAKFAKHHEILLVSGKRKSELRYKILESEMFQALIQSQK